MTAAVTTLFSYKDKSKASSVSVVGSWDGWEQKLPMVKDREVWQVKKKLQSGKFSFKFVVDGRWTTSKAYDVQDDGFGGVNNVIHIAPMYGRKKTTDVGASIGKGKGIAGTEQKDGNEKNEGLIESLSSEENIESTSKNARRIVQFASAEEEKSTNHQQSTDEVKHGEDKTEACIIC